MLPQLLPYTCYSAMLRHYADIVSDEGGADSWSWMPQNMNIACHVEMPRVCYDIHARQH